MNFICDYTKFGQNLLINGRQKSKMAVTRFSFFDISTSDRGDFTRIIDITLLFFIPTIILQFLIPQFNLGKFNYNYFNSKKHKILSLDKRVEGKKLLEINLEWEMVGDNAPLRVKQGLCYFLIPPINDSSSLLVINSTCPSSQWCWSHRVAAPAAISSHPHTSPVTPAPKLLGF